MLYICGLCQAVNEPIFSRDKNMGSVLLNLGLNESII